MVIKEFSRINTIVPLPEQLQRQGLRLKFNGGHAKDLRAKGLFLDTRYDFHKGGGNESGLLIHITDFVQTLRAVPPETQSIALGVVALQARQAIMDGQLISTSFYDEDLQELAMVTEATKEEPAAGHITDMARAKVVATRAEAWNSLIFLYAVSELDEFNDRRLKREDLMTGVADIPETLGHSFHELTRLDTVASALGIDTSYYQSPNSIEPGVAVINGKKKGSRRSIQN